MVDVMSVPVNDKLSLPAVSAKDIVRLGSLLSTEIAEAMALIPLPRAAVELFDTLCQDNEAACSTQVLGPARILILTRLLARFSTQKGLMPVLHSDGGTTALVKCLLRIATRTDDGTTIVSSTTAQSMLSFMFANMRCEHDPPAPLRLVLRSGR